MKKINFTWEEIYFIVIGFGLSIPIVLRELKGCRVSVWGGAFWGPAMLITVLIIIVGKFFGKNFVGDFKFSSSKNEKLSFILLNILLVILLPFILSDLNQCLISK